MAQTTDLATHLERFQAAKDHREKIGWDAIMAKAYRYIYGDQWESADKRKLLSEHRAPAVFNNILPAFDLIVGHFVVNRVDLVAKPVDKDADPFIAAMLTGTFKCIDQNNDAGDQERAQFMDAVATGFGVSEIWNDTTESLEGEIRYQQGPSWEYYLDPHFRQYDYSDARDLFRAQWVDYSDVPRIYGKKIAKEIGEPVDTGNGWSFPTGGHAPATFSGHSSNYGLKEGDTLSLLQMEECGYDPTRKRVRVIEHFEKVWDEVEFVIDETTGNPIRVDTLQPTERELVKGQTFTKWGKHIHLTTIIGNVIAQDVELEITEFNQRFNFLFAYFLNGKYWGLIENLFYPQDEINHRHAVTVDVLSSRGIGSVIYDRRLAGDRDEAEMTELFSRNNQAIAVDKMLDETTGNKLYDTLPPPEVPSEFFTLEAQAKEDMKYISGATNSMQGIAERKTSGAAKRIDVEQGGIRLAALISNFRHTLRLRGRAYLHLIQTTMTEERMMRIFGKLGDSDEEITINHRAMGEIFNDVTVGKYDVTFDYEGLTQSQRERTVYKMIEMANTAPQYAGVLAREVMRMQDFPEKDRVIQEMEAIQQQQAAMAQQTQQPGGTFTKPSASPRREPAAMQA